MAVPVGEVEFDEGEPLVVGALVTGHFDDESAVETYKIDQAEGVWFQQMPRACQFAGYSSVRKDSRTRVVRDNRKLWGSVYQMLMEFVDLSLVEGQLDVGYRVAHFVDDVDDRGGGCVVKVLAVKPPPMAVIHL